MTPNELPDHAGGEELSETERVFSPDQVENLAIWQTKGQFHPFTCPERGDGNHRDIYGDLGALIPTTRGWICPFCDYTQNWAHGFMAGPALREPTP